MNTDLVQDRAKPNPVSHFICFCFSQILEIVSQFHKSRGQHVNMSYGPAHNYTTSIREYPLGLAFSMVMSQLSLIVFFPFSSLSNDLRCNLGNMDHKKGRPNHQTHPILQKELSYMYSLEAVFIKFISLLALIQALQINLLFFRFWGNVNS